MFKNLNLKLLGLTLGTTLSLSLLSGQECYEPAPCETSCTEQCSPFAVRLGYTTPRSIPTKHGYATLAAFYCPSNFDCWAPYADFRVHHLDNGRWAGNIGLGIQKRLFTYCGQSVSRTYAYYDWRKTSYRNYSQVTVGTEWLGERFDVRLNTYWPTKHQGHAKDVRVHNFRGGYYAKREKLQYTWRGVELDLSKRLCFWQCLDLYLTVGPYWLKSKHNSTSGLKFRAEAAIWKGLVVAVQTSYDRHFRNRTFGEISWTLPLGGDCCATPCCEPVRRQELIVLNKHCHWKTNY